MPAFEDAPLSVKRLFNWIQKSANIPWQIKSDMLHGQADIALDAFFVQIAEQKKSWIKGPVAMTAPCHKFWPAEEYHPQLIGLIRQKWQRDTGCLEGLSAACVV